MKYSPPTADPVSDVDVSRPTAATGIPAAQPDAVGATLHAAGHWRGADDVEIDVIVVSQGGRIPDHLGRRDQLCIVVCGTGSVTGGGVVAAVGVGDTVLWRSGELRSVVAEEELVLVSVRVAQRVTRP